MNEQAQINYNRIAEAIDYIKEHFNEHPNLDEVAEKVNVSLYCTYSRLKNYRTIVK